MKLTAAQPMIKYKLKLKHEQINYLYQSASSMFALTQVLNSIDHVEYYNIKHFLKRLHDKLYHLSTVRIIKQHTYTISIDMNEHRALLQLYLFGKNHIQENPYLQNLYLDIFIQVDKQEINIRDEHKRMYPPTNTDAYKYQIDFNNIA